MLKQFQPWGRLLGFSIIFSMSLSAVARPSIEYDGANLLIHFSLPDTRSQSRFRVGMRALRMAQQKLTELITAGKIPLTVNDLSTAEKSDEMLEDFANRLEKYLVNKAHKGQQSSSFYPSAFYVSVGGKVSKSLGLAVSGSVNFGLVVMPTLTFVIPTDELGLELNERLTKPEEQEIARVVIDELEKKDPETTAPTPSGAKEAALDSARVARVLNYVQSSTKPHWSANFSFFFSPNVDAGIGLEKAPILPANPGHRTLFGAIWGNMGTAKDFAGVSVGFSGAVPIPVPIPLVGNVALKIKTGGLHNFALPGFAQFYYFAVGYETSLVGDFGIHINAVAPVFSGKRILGLLGIDENQYLRDEQLQEKPYMKGSLAGSVIVPPEVIP